MQNLFWNQFYFFLYPDSPSIWLKHLEDLGLRIFLGCHGFHENGYSTHPQESCLVHRRLKCWPGPHPHWRAAGTAWWPFTAEGPPLPWQSINVGGGMVVVSGVLGPFSLMHLCWKIQIEHLIHIWMTSGQMVCQWQIFCIGLALAGKWADHRRFGSKSGCRLVLSRAQNLLPIIPQKLPAPLNKTICGHFRFWTCSDCFPPCVLSGQSQARTSDCCILIQSIDSDLICSMYFSKIHGSYPAYRIPRVNAPSPFSTSRVVRTEHIPEATPQASKSGAGIQDADTLPATDSQLVLWPLLPVPHQIQAWQFLSLFFHCLDSIATPPCQIFCLNLPGHIEPLPFKFPFIWGSATADPDVPKGPSGCSYGHAAAGWHVKHTQVWDIPGSTKRWFQEKGT